MTLSAAGQKHRSAVSSPYLWAVGGALLLSSFAFYNGFPLVFEDSVGYLQRPARILGRYGIESEWDYLRPIARGSAGNVTQAWMTGRSVYYGTFNAILATIGSSWLIVAIQAYIVALAISIPWSRCGIGGISYLATVAMLSVLTSASVFVATLLPDVLVAVAVLATAATLALGDRLRRLDIVFLTSAMSYAAVAHDSILLMLVVTLVLAAAFMVARAATRAWGRLVPLGASCVAGFVGGVLFWLVALAATGEPPMRLPHLTAKLATSTEGRAFMDEACPERQFAVCAFRDQIGKTGWIDFLFSRDPNNGVFGIADTATKRAMNDEQLAFGLEMAMHDPEGVARLQLRSTVELLGSFTVMDLDVSKKRNFFSANVSDKLHDRIAKTETYSKSSVTLNTVSQLTYVTVAFSMFVLAGTWLMRIRARRVDAVDAMAALLCGGVFLNAAVCANVAGVYDRFQARVIWLVPLAAVIVVMHAYGKNRLPAPSQTSTDR